MKKVLLPLALLLFTVLGYSQVSFKILKETFTRPDTVIFENETPNTSTLQWSFPYGIAHSVIDNIDTVIYVTPGRYTVGLVVESDDKVVDTLIKQNFVFVPGILSKDTVLCTTDTIKLIATGGADYYWNNSSMSDSTLVNYSPTSGYYKVKIILDTNMMTDSIRIIVATEPTIAPNTTKYCLGDPTALLFPDFIKSYSLTNLVYDGKEAYNSGKIKLGPFTNKSPYYFTSSEMYYLDYLDTLGCPWNNKKYDIGNSSIQRPSINIENQTMCKGSQFMLYSSTAMSDWYKNGEKLVTESISFTVSDTGVYVVKAYDDSYTCSTTDTVVVTYTSANPESIKSVNYLPGIGYVSSYTKYYNNESYALFNESGHLIDSISVDMKYTYGKSPIFIDTTTYESAPSLYMKSYNTCNKSASSKTVRPVWLNVQYEINTGGNILSWSNYVINNVSTYYIFKGTKPENMKLLAEVAGSTLEYTDTVATPGAIYSIGVKDDNKVDDLYKDMLLNWQAGYITSNISPRPAKYSRIGVFAFLQNDNIGSRVYFQAIAPKADSIKWEFEGPEGSVNTSNGAKTDNYYSVGGLYDVTVKTFTNNVIDSVVLKDFIKIGNAIYFAIDTIYKTVGNDTLSINIASIIKNNVSMLSSSKVDWFLSQETKSPRAMITKAVNNTKDSLLIWVNPIVGDTTITIPLSGYYIDAYYPSGSITLIVSGKKNEQPSLIDSIPDQFATLGKKFNPIYLPDYIKDDFTQFSELKFITESNSFFKFSVIDGYLYAEQTDGSFTGTTETTLKVIDGNGLEANFLLHYTQPYLVNVPIALPKASFSSNKLIIEPSSSVRFSTQLFSADSIEWNFSGGVKTSGSIVNPTVTFDKAGKYTITLTAKNSIGKIDVVKQNYIVATALSLQDTTICKGDSVTIAVLGAGFNSYLWNTNQTTSSIKVAPTKTTNYKITMFKGVSKIVDSVTIYISTQPELGNDTTFCEGGTLKLTPGMFNSYYWNGSTVAGLSYFEATTSGKIIVKTIDSRGCIAKDSVTIKSLYSKPVVNLGKDSVFCWKKNIMLDAQNSGAKYKWSSGETTQTIFTDTTATFSVTVTDVHLCANSDTITLKAIVPIVPSIGLVTNSDLGKNLIAWEPQLNKGIELYHVWRESSSSNTFEIIDTIYINDTTISIDQKSSPKIMSYNYALSTVDAACRNESNLSQIYSSIHLTCVLDSNKNVKARWNNDQKLFISQYIIYRAKKGEPLVAYDTVDVVNGSSMIEYIDTNAIGLNSYYQVRFNLNKTLTPSRLKSDSGPFSQSLSNMAESELTEVESVSDSKIRISPNPTNTTATVTIPTLKSFTVSVIDLLGRKLQIKEGVGTIIIDCTTLNKGIYILKMQSENLITSQSLIVE